MNLKTTYLGFVLPHPIIPGASPMVDNLDTVRRLEDAGAPMIIMHSLFEEQIVAEEVAVGRALEFGDEMTAEALSFFPRPAEFRLGPDLYLDQIRKIKQSVDIPVVASLNGTTEGGWIRYAKLMQDAGADALELNLYELATSVDESGESIEERSYRLIRSIKETLDIPVAVKLSPFYTSIAHYAKRLDELGVAGLVLFNRFYQPDIDVEQVELIRVNLSSPAELPLRLRWVGILHGKIRASLGITGGVHSVADVIKAVMCGADGVQMVSALLQRGPAYLAQIRTELERWLEDRDYESLSQMRGSMSLLRCDNPHAYERANYVRILQSWQTDI